MIPTLVVNNVSKIKIVFRVQEYFRAEYEIPAGNTSVSNYTIILVLERCLCITVFANETYISF